MAKTYDSLYLELQKVHKERDELKKSNEDLKKLVEQQGTMLKEVYDWKKRKEKGG